MYHQGSIVNDGYKWYAVRLFSTHQSEVTDYFIENNLECFIPEEYEMHIGRDGKRHHTLRPVVRNLIFVKKTISDTEMRQIATACIYPISIMRKTAPSPDYYEISSDEMYEFRLMCNPEIMMRQYLPTEEARLKPGAEVMVKYGPLKGLTGRLVRSNKKYFLLKEIPGISVMIKVGRWCCVPKAENQSKNKDLMQENSKK